MDTPRQNSTKSKLRSYFKNELKLQFEATKLQRACLAANQILTLVESRKFRHVALFASDTYEIQTKPLFECLLQRRVHTYFPRISNDMLEFLPVQSWSDLKPGKFNILAPYSGFACTPSTLELIIVPGLVFDLKGFRLGRGKGYYDKFLPSLGPFSIRVGYAYDFQLVDHLPAEPHDQKMDFVVTESRTLTV
ncbi:MAG: 5-formyltetrahydrofolate cyclo-ligase, partial [Bdellovibrionales bacterium]|nr:5-formyltetrahydrofolate cyclo-ligase [Bdellovibrionales bacterium]